MLIYVDTMIAQYIADNIDYIMWLGGYLALEEADWTKMPKGDSKYRIEIEALGKLAFLEQMGNTNSIWRRHI